MPAFNARDYVNAWNTHAVDKIAEHYAENAELTAPDAAQPIRGRDAIRQNIQGWITAFPDVTGDIESTAANGDKVALLVHFSGTHKGVVELRPGQRVQATNKKVDLPVGMFLTLDANGKIVKERDIYNIADFITQLSIPADAASKMMTGPR